MRSPDTDLLMSAQTFVRQVVAPVAAAADEREEFPVDVFRAAGRFGVFGAGFPSEYGGLALGWAVYTGLIREIAQACASTAMSAVAHATLAMLPIFLGGSERLKQRLLPALIGGEAIAAFAMTEAGSGSDIAAIATTATDAGEHFLLNGSKVFITNANVADVAVVVAKTAPAAGILGLSLLAVERGTPGFQATGRRERKLGMRASDTGELVFTDALVPKDNLIGRRNGGFAILQRTLPAARLDMAAIAIGISERARDLCVDHAVGRRQFGKPIGRFQLVQQMLADMETSIDAASLLLARGLELRERGLPLAKAASEAKLFASEMAVEITRNAIQVHGASGYSRDLPLERLYRDAKLTEIGDGTSEIQRLIIADEMIKERLARIPGR
ncbi:Acyl-CoA dehydrogenase [Blastochloris viridis]|uniref:3-sulfinopropanoyl-CoA desulfinase n=2 Tax=Blastochloris viridis TaxID=1079 RepID=A0A0P0IX86_BLAVI|nr:Acyl-CoA dehydrogenase [Blastochloris viridis]CUU43270.1 Acyl-CoA dehydrogenase, short-chain specific [Blastochloris viridis]